MRGFDAADSERAVRPESPTSPNVEIGTYREKPPYPMLAGGLWSRHIAIGRIWPWGNKACDGWKQPAFLVTPEQHRVKDIYCVLGLLRSQQCKRQQFFPEVSNHGNSDSIFVMCCVSVPVLSEQNMSKPQVLDQDVWWSTSSTKQQFTSRPWWVQLRNWFQRHRWRKAWTPQLRHSASGRPN